MSTYDWNKLLIDRGLMTRSEETVFSQKHTLYHQANHKINGGQIDKSELEPYFGKPNLQYHRRKRQYLAFRHPSIVDLICTISNGRPEIVPWIAAHNFKHCLVVSQPHDGTFFANAWMPRPLGCYTIPILRMLSSHTEVLSIYSSSNDDPCSYQRWIKGKCARAIEWIPDPQTGGKLVDFGMADSNDPTYNGRPWYMDINRSLEATRHAGHLIPPMKSKNEEVLAWKVYLPEILK